MTVALRRDEIPATRAPVGEPPEPPSSFERLRQAIAALEGSRRELAALIRAERSRVS